MNAMACVIVLPSTFAYYLDLLNFLWIWNLDCRILEFYPSVSCWSVLWVLQDVAALIKWAAWSRNGMKWLTLIHCLGRIATVSLT